jgi:hypothetical protein
MCSGTRKNLHWDTGGISAKSVLKCSNIESDCVFKNEGMMASCSSIALRITRIEMENRPEATFVDH